MGAPDNYKRDVTEQNMIHCQMNYSDNKFCRSSGEGVLISDWGARFHEDKWELVLRLDK